MVVVFVKAMVVGKMKRIVAFEDTVAKRNGLSGLDPNRGFGFSFSAFDSSGYGRVCVAAYVHFSNI